MRPPSDPILVIGAGGAQGREFVGYLRAGLPDATIVGIDRRFTPEAVERLAAFDASAEVLDLLEDGARLKSLFASAQIIVNLAGPFYRLGTRVLDTAIAAGVPYLDICDDIDATRALLDRGDAALAAGMTALVGMGSAPGTTNLLVKLAVDALETDGGGRRRADISWCAPESDLTNGVFQHMVHCFKTAIDGRDAVPDWSELEPRAVRFPDPIGPVEVVRLGHPEPLTLERYFACPTVLRGGLTNSGVLRRCWELARACDHGQSQEEAWNDLRGQLETGSPGAPGLSGMVVDVFVEGRGIRFESATEISMEQSTAVPAAAAVLMMLEGEGLGPGVWTPEALSPAAFFAASGRVSPGGGGLRAYRLQGGERGDRIPLRALLDGTPA
jgi:saccharopine dehydrogenase (NAD+, L-lysine-forming)